MTVSLPKLQLLQALTSEKVVEAQKAVVMDHNGRNSPQSSKSMKMDLKAIAQFFGAILVSMTHGI